MPKLHDSNREILTDSEKFTLKFHLMSCIKTIKREKQCNAIAVLGPNTDQDSRRSIPVQIQLGLTSNGIPVRPASTRWMTGTELQTGRTQPRHHWVRAE